MVSQYPHIIIIPGTAPDSEFQNGKWVTHPKPPDVRQACRYEPSPIAKTLEVADGLVINYKGVVYLPLSTPLIQNGVAIEVEGVVSSKTVYFYRGQMNCTLYI